MEQFKDWLMVQLIDFGMGIAFFVFIALVFGIWSICEYLEEKEWNILIKIFLGLVILIVGGFIVNITIALGFRHSSMLWFYLIKAVIGGISIPLVFFKIIPEKGKYIALFFVLTIVALFAYNTFNAYNQGYADLGTNLEGLIWVASSIITYLILSKSKQIDHDN